MLSHAPQPEPEARLGAEDLSSAPPANLVPLQGCLGFSSKSASRKTALLASVITALGRLRQEIG